ncbi:2Fe-2S iron-sulfur cluster-binding protein [Maricurvus nonylphenolicus]|uniref:2Fe-2S iron-sulfur cluster-binding protein n=1 Tax=Maricurvus nonylphenolicus TaxID=1008307 RepID=UPI0036F3F560
MAKITFIEHNGSAHEVEASEGQTLMQAALDNAVPGIDADCGGSCACGTCHVIISPEWAEKIEAANDTETSMIDMTPEKQDHSRLACQVELNEAHDGLVVNLPEFQM